TADLCRPFSGSRTTFSLVPPIGFGAVIVAEGLERSAKVGIFIERLTTVDVLVADLLDRGRRKVGRGRLTACLAAITPRAVVVFAHREESERPKHPIPHLSQSHAEPGAP